LNLISTISTIGICLGVATLLIALSIVKGFEKTLKQKIIELDSHVKIFSIDYDKFFDFESISPLLSQFTEKIEYYSPFLSNTVIVNRKNISDGVTLKGVENPFYLDKISSNLISGKLDFSQRNNLVIGSSFAKRLSLKVGDKVSLISINKSDIDKGEFPNIDVFFVVGIYESGLTKYDDIIAFTDLRSAQDFVLGGKNQINGVDIKLRYIEDIPFVTSFLRERIKYPIYAQNLFEMHRNIFAWIELQKKPIPIALSLIIIVAVFNIISTLFLMVIERTPSVGILKSFGVKRKQIVGLFLLQGLQITTYGIIAGNILALILMFIQSYFNLIKVPSSIYMVTNVPFDYSIEIFVMVSSITLVLSLMASIIPSWISSKINPIKAIRFL
jgi:lipoprotein-releasing system permease protein